MKKYIISFVDYMGDLAYCVSIWFSSDGGRVYYNCNQNSYFRTEADAKAYIEILKSV